MKSVREIVRVGIAVATACIVAASAANAPTRNHPPVQFWDLPTHSRIACALIFALRVRYGGVGGRDYGRT